MIEIITIILPVMTFLLGWELQKRLSDRHFLRNEIFSPLYEEARMLAKNISEFKSCYTQRYGRPDFSAPLPRDKVPGYIRKILILTGKYKKIPQKLRVKLDEYYNSCESYNKLLADSMQKITKICRNEIRKIKTQNDQIKWDQSIDGKKFPAGANYISHPNFLLKGVVANPMPVLDDNQGFSLEEYYSGWDSIITRDDLKRNHLLLKDILENLLPLVNKEKSVIKLRKIQQQLKNPKDLIGELENRISNPNPLFGG